MNLVKRVAVSSFLPWIIAFGGILLATVLALKSIMLVDAYEKERFKTATKQITNLVQKRLESNVQLFTQPLLLCVHQMTFHSKIGESLHFPKGYLSALKAFKGWDLLHGLIHTM